MADETIYKAGDKVKLVASHSGSEEPVRIGDLARPGFFSVVFNGQEGAIKYDQVYQVSGLVDLQVVDNSHRPLPYIAKDFVNHPVFNSLFTGVKEPENNNNKDEE